MLRSPLPTSRFTAAMFVLALFVAEPAGAETWYEVYHQAEEALDRESWSEAVLLLNTALEENPTSGLKVRTYGMRFIAYFPFLHLGVAYYHLGQIEAAERALDTEENQGAVSQSRDALTLLESYRGRIASDRLAENDARELRVIDLVAENFRTAAELEADSRFEDALSALAKALAVEPSHQGALEAQDRLRAAIAEQQLQMERRGRRARLVERGQAELSSKRYRQAAATFSEALEITSDDAIRSLLVRAQAGLRAEIDAQQSVEQRRQMVDESLSRAIALANRSDLSGALVELQAVLALDPGNTKALSLQADVLRSQSEVAQATGRESTIRDLLASAETLLTNGSYEEALRSSNLVLSLEPTNDTALQQIARAYPLLADALLASDDAPPAILLDGGRGGEDGVTEIVRSPQLVLTGTIFDGTPVELRVLVDEQSGNAPRLESHQLQGVWITDFEWRHELPAGISMIEVHAIDADGNTARVHHRVEYVVPFLSSPSFPASIGATVASVIGAFLFVRARRKRQLLRGRFNPYVAGAPILEHERYFGRQQLLEYVLRRVCNNSIMLYGERRIGKTSFQHRLKKCLATLDDPDFEFYPVFIDLQGVPQDKFFATLAAEVFHELAPKLKGLQPSTPPSQNDYSYRELVKDIHVVLKALEKRSKKKVKLVLLIDEVDELNHYDPRINQRLRSLFMRAFAESLVSVVSGVAIKKHWEREGSPWYNFFQEIEVVPLDPGEARSLIEKPVRGIFTFQAGAAAEIVRRTDSKPYRIQRICSGLVDRMHEERRQLITLEDVETACQVEGL